MNWPAGEGLPAPPTGDSRIAPTATLVVVSCRWWVIRPSGLRRLSKNAGSIMNRVRVLDLAGPIGLPNDNCGERIDRSE